MIPEPERSRIFRDGEGGVHKRSSRDSDSFPKVQREFETKQRVGMWIEARTLVSLAAETEKIQFLVGTQSLKTENQVRRNSVPGLKLSVESRCGSELGRGKVLTPDLPAGSGGGDGSDPEVVLRSSSRRNLAPRSKSRPARPSRGLLFQRFASPTTHSGLSYHGWLLFHPSWLKATTSLNPIRPFTPS